MKLSLKTIARRGARSAARKRWQRDIWSREQRRVRRGGKPDPRYARIGRLIWLIAKAPTKLDIYDARDRGLTSSFLKDLREGTRRHGVGLTIDLSGITKITPTGAVLLLAEIDRALAGQEPQTLRIVRCRDPIVDAVMCQIGIYETGEAPTPEADRDDVKHWHHATGVASEGEKGGSILEAYEGRLAGDLTSDLYAGIVEAMTNTVHHAYRGEIGTDLRRFIGKRWWALSQEREGELTIAFCDLGIGIPRSLPRSSTFERPVVQAMWKSLGLDRSDANAIKVAVELGRTSTGQQGRGRGLSEIIEAANLSPGGRVLISSNRGVFVSVDGKAHSHDHSHSIRGTLIHWTVRFDDGDVAHGE